MAGALRRRSSARSPARRAAIVLLLGALSACAASREVHTALRCAEEVSRASPETLGQEHRRLAASVGAKGDDAGRVCMAVLLLRPDSGLHDAEKALRLLTATAGSPEAGEDMRRLAALLIPVVEERLRLEERLKAANRRGLEDKVKVEGLKRQIEELKEIELHMDRRKK